jgi:signal transduction histidine kinase
MGEGIAGRAAREGKPILVPDVERDTRFTPRVDAHTGFKTRSIVCVPIKHKGRLVGVLEVLNKRRGPFEENDVELLTVVSNQIGIAMENARLYERLRERFTLTAEELRKTQQKVIHSERMVALARLSQGVAHEVRNPVMCIGGFARRMKQKLSPDDPVYKYAEIIVNESARLEKMVQDIEEYARMRQPEFSEVKLRELLQHVVEDWRVRGGLAKIDLRLDLPDDEMTFPADEQLLCLVFDNLFRNAAEAMDGEGLLSVAAYSEAGQVIITVTDTGRGIPSEALPLIFDPFYTSSTRGSGLGLTTVDRIVSGHHGTVSVYSAPGAGTEFRIQLPLYPDDMQLSALEAS